MPAKPLFDMSKIDVNTVIVDSDGIDAVNPQRFEFKQLDGLFLIDHECGEMAGFRDVKEDEFWVRGHIPGRPLFPGVLMIESAAQLVSYYAMTDRPDGGFVGFGGVTGVKFRGEIGAGDRIVLLAKVVEMRRRRCVGDVQGYVDKKLVFEGTITGMWI